MSIVYLGIKHMAHAQEATAALDAIMINHVVQSQSPEPSATGIRFCSL